MQLTSYFKDVLKEIKNIKFPTWQEVKMTSIVIVLILIVMMSFIGVADFFISKLIKMLLGII